MNKVIFISSLLILFLGFSSLIAQTSQGFTYQAVARDSDGEILANKQNMTVTIIINKGNSNGTEVLREPHENKSTK